MEPVNVGDITPVLSDEQLVIGARAVSSRACQLADITSWRVDDSPGNGAALNNARLESALVNARALSYFLSSKPPSDDDLHISHYSKSAWKKGASKISRVAGRIIEASTIYLGNPMTTEHRGEVQSGHWPLPEIAVVLTRGLADFVDALAAKDFGKAAWFCPSPRQTYESLMASDPLGTPTENNEKSTAADLLKILQKQLA